MTKSDEKDNFSAERKMLRFCGVSLKEVDATWYKVYSFVVVGGMSSLLIVNVHNVLVNTSQLNVLIENLLFLEYFLLGSFKIWYALGIRKKLGKTLLTLQSSSIVTDNSWNEFEADKLKKKCVLYMNRQTILLWSAAATSLFIGAAENLVQGHGNSVYSKLPFGDFSFFDTTCSPNYEIVWLYQTIFVSMGCVACVTIDCVAGAVMIYLSFQCKILQAMIRKPIKTIVQPKHQSVAPEWKYLQVTLRKIVAHHVSITEMAKKFENLFYVEILINFCGLSVIICSALFYATLIPTFHNMEHLFVASGAVALQLMISYWGNEVTLQCTAIGQSCYEVGFVGTDLRFQKGLCLIIRESQNPVQFTVGNFFPLTLNSFIMVMRTAYSYFTLLYNLKKKANPVI